MAALTSPPTVFISSAKWQATWWPGVKSRKAGSSVAQRSGLPRRSRSQQRVWNRQPDGGLAGDGMSPLSTSRFFLSRGLGFGMADRSATVYGWRGLRVELVDAGHLDHPPEVHDPDPVADVLDDREVVGDEQVGEPEFLLEVVEQVQDLALDRHVEGRHRLVADDEVRVDRQRPGDADALALAAAELVRVAVDVALVEAHLAEQLADERFALLACPTGRGRGGPRRRSRRPTCAG